jgi:hypothetical protein
MRLVALPSNDESPLRGRRDGAWSCHETLTPTPVNCTDLFPGLSSISLGPRASREGRRAGGMRSAVHESASTWLSCREQHFAYRLSVHFSSGSTGCLMASLEGLTLYRECQHPEYTRRPMTPQVAQRGVARRGGRERRKRGKAFSKALGWRLTRRNLLCRIGIARRLAKRSNRHGRGAKPVNRC